MNNSEPKSIFKSSDCCFIIRLTVCECEYFVPNKPDYICPSTNTSMRSVVLVLPFPFTETHSDSRHHQWRRHDCLFSPRRTSRLHQLLIVRRLQEELNRLQRIRNALAICVVEFESASHSNMSLQQLYWLPIGYLFIFKVAKFAFFGTTSSMSSYLNESASYSLHSTPLAMLWRHMLVP